MKGLTSFRGVRAAGRELSYSAHLGSSNSFDEVKALDDKYILGTYARTPILFTKGEGAKFYDGEGKEYLDFSSGIAVNALGSAHPEWLEALTRQANEIHHCSNLFYTAAGPKLAQKMVESHAAMGKVFFCSTGCEANEAALKFARRVARTKFPDVADKTHIVVFDGGFHGRTMGALSMTSNNKYKDPFAPLVPNIHAAPFNGLCPKTGPTCIINEQTCAVFVEPVQGEGGVHPSDPEFLASLRARCDEVGALLVFDEVQCGLGRTGTLYAHEDYGVSPDILTLAKPLAGGLPMGAVLVTDDVASCISPGDHGTTFGGNPLVCAVADTVFSKISEPDFLAEVRRKGDVLREALTRALSEEDLAGVLKQVRGKGLMCGIELTREVKPVVDRCAELGLVIINAGTHVLRVVPPLIISDDEIVKGVDIVAEAIRTS